MINVMYYYDFSPLLPVDRSDTTLSFDDHRKYNEVYIIQIAGYCVDIMVIMDNFWGSAKASSGI